MAFANTTQVPVHRSQEEIRRTLEKYGATGFMFGESNEQALCAFEMNNRRIKFVIGVPKGKTEKEKQKIRSSWRCLLLAIKAKLECAASGISTFEQEFLAHIVMPNGQTVGEAIVPQIADSYKTGKLPPLLSGRTS